MSLKEKNEEFDYYQEVARSAFADMLHDTERNQKYSMALKEAIDTVHGKGLQANVLDIGTGTGLLAMLAAKHGADSVVTIEAFSPVSHVARDIIEKNGFKNKIQIINKHSTEVSVGAGKDMEQKANILVAEVFDTELIGEGAIKTYNHAHANLMKKDCICVPDSASVYIQVVQSELALLWNRFCDGYYSLRCPQNVAACSGAPAVHDLQLSQLDTRMFNIKGGSINICNFDFSGKTIIQTNEKFTKSFKAAMAGQIQIVFFWWELKMNPSGTILLSCAPHWSHPDTDRLAQSDDQAVRRNSIPWRDHWMQGCYFLNSNEWFDKDEKAYITAFHDEFSWWFDIREKPDDTLAIERPVCSCLFHVANSRNRIYQINDLYGRYNPKLFSDEEPNYLLFIGDHILWALHISLVQKRSKVFVLQEDSFCAKSLENFASYNKVKVHFIKDLKEIGYDVTYVMAEPHFNSSVLPWDNSLKLWKYVRELRDIQHQEFTITPASVKIFAVPVSFLNLHKIRWPLKSTCGGFDHELFDQVIEAASLKADENVEPFSLWEYPSISLSEPKEIFNLDFSCNEIEISDTTVNIEDFSKVCNGIVLWVEYPKLQDNFEMLATYDARKFSVGEIIRWYLQDRQGVHLIPSSNVEVGFKSVKISTRFDQVDDKLSMDFNYL